MWSIIREYLSRSSFHGLHYLVDPGLHWTERIFWLICVLSCWGGSVYLMNSWLVFAYFNTISLSVDSHYLHWMTPVSGIVVCEANSEKMLQFKNLLQRENLHQRIFFNYYLSDKIEHNYTENMDMFKNYRSNCTGIFNYCSWQGVEFNCCEKFHPLETAIGTCYSINTIQSSDMNWDLLTYTDKKGGNLILEFKNPCTKIFAISNDEIVTDSNKPIILQNAIGAYAEYKVYLLVSHTTSEPEIRDVEVERRKCRFPDENYLDVARNYSFDACKLQCQKDTHLRLFNCTHHYMPFIDKKYICTEEQLNNLMKQSIRWRQEAEKNCYCELGCTYTSVLFVGKVVTTKRTVKLNKNDSNSYAHINFEISTVRTTRKMAHTILDNIVNIGGTAGLFVGASLLSIVEIFYYFTIRAIDSSLMKKQKLKKRKPKPRLIVTEPILIEVYPFVN